MLSPAQLPVLTGLAREFAVCDGWRASMPGLTWPNRFFMMAASSGGLDHSPSIAQIAEWMTIDGFGFEHGSLFDALSRAQETRRGGARAKDHDGLTGPPPAGTI